MKHLSILGSTGSIGCNALEIAAMFPERFRVKALAAKSNVDLLAEQIERFAPGLAVVYDEDRAAQLKERLRPGAKTEILWGQEGYQTSASAADRSLPVSNWVMDCCIAIWVMIASFLLSLSVGSSCRSWCER